MPAKGQDAVQTSLIIARLVGPLFATIGVGMLTNTETYRRIAQEYLTNPAIIYFSGILLLLIGLAILNAHNAWTRDWRSAVTFIGWLMTVVGVWRIIAPQFIPFAAGAVVANKHFFVAFGVLLITLGGFVTYKGYAPPEARQ
jgi:uncharacterized membrane protein